MATRGANAWAVALPMLLAAGLARADTLVGNNGERLAGQLIEEKDGRIVFMSDLLGRVEVASDKARVETTPPAAVRGTETETGTAAVAAAAPPEAETEAVRPVRWELDIGAKLSLDRGSLKTPEDRTSATLVLVRATERGELHGDASYKYKRTDGDLRDDDWHASLAYDRFLGERSFRTLKAVVDSELTSDDQYDDTLVLGATMGWRLWEAPGRHFRIGPTLGYLVATRGDGRYEGPAIGVFARLLAPLPGDTSLSGEMQILDSMGDGRYATLQMRARRPLGDRLFIALAWQYDWSDFAIESGITSEWRWELGWQWGPDED